MSSFVAALTAAVIGVMSILGIVVGSDVYLRLLDHLAGREP